MGTQQESVNLLSKNRITSQGKRTLGKSAASTQLSEYMKSISVIQSQANASINESPVKRFNIEGINHCSQEQTGSELRMKSKKQLQNKMKSCSVEPQKRPNRKQNNQNIQNLQDIILHLQREHRDEIEEEENSLRPKSELYSPTFGMCKNYNSNDYLINMIDSSILEQKYIYNSNLLKMDFSQQQESINKNFQHKIELIENHPQVEDILNQEDFKESPISKIGFQKIPLILSKSMQNKNEPKSSRIFVQSKN
eukprot:403342318